MLEKRSTGLLVGPEMSRNMVISSTSLMARPARIPGIPGLPGRVTDAFGHLKGAPLDLDGAFHGPHRPGHRHLILARRLDDLQAALHVHLDIFVFDPDLPGGLQGEVNL